MDPPKNVLEVIPLLDMVEYSSLNTHPQYYVRLRNPFHGNVKSSGNSLLGYKAKLEIKLQVDAGRNGLGLMLMQKRKTQGWKAIEFAIRSLTEEKSYSQIDRGALAICWAFERCYMYLIDSCSLLKPITNSYLPFLYCPFSTIHVCTQQTPMIDPRIECWLPLYLRQFG